MRRLLLILTILISTITRGQELYVFTEPASNMPAHSIALKLTDHFVTKDDIYGRFSQRIMPEIMFGFSKKLMLHLSTTISNMHTEEYGLESYAIYAKYRFLSKDDVHRHFRMAVFADGSYSRVPFHYDDISLMGDKSGIELGLIATQLTNRLAVSGTLSRTEVFDKSKNSDVIYVPARRYQSLNYSLSSGYLVLPKEYTDYKQTNFNIYLEFLGQSTLDLPGAYLDMAPAVQLIFNSNFKVNLGYRFQLAGNLDRMSKQSWQISFERTFLNALKKK